MAVEIFKFKVANVPSDNCICITKILEIISAYCFHRAHTAAIFTFQHLKMLFVCICQTKSNGHVHDLIFMYFFNRYHVKIV